MPSLAEQALMLEALSGDSDRQMPHSMRAYREEAAANPDRWSWCIAEAASRASEALATPNNDLPTGNDGGRG
jgi:hypothetical protein